ncbi:MAG TPA: TetR/AcrR family transcriptional regulator [Opitutaceae bacterium]|nr:TetR/AcrR family transcriptional regulator [Opitutaceae bacterium]
MGRTSDADERLMTAALDLMWEESYGAVSIDDICQRAEVKKGSFYYFFDSKAELAAAALEKLWRDDWKSKLDACFSPSVEPLERLKNYMAAIYEKHASHFKQTGHVLGCPVCSVGSEVSTQEIDLSAKIREIVARKRRYYESAIRDAIAEGVIEPGDPGEKAVGLACLIEGAVSQARIMNDPELLKPLPVAMLALLGAKSPATATSATAK